MAKTIKFNLVCDGCQIRTLEDLRNHFSIEDILQYYRDKILEKWLTVRGYADELKKVQSIKSTSPLDIVKELVSIFQVETEKDKIEYATAIIKYRDQRVLAVQKLTDKSNQSVRFLNEYFNKYSELIQEIINNPNDKNTIQAAITEIVDSYYTIFSMDYRYFFYNIRDISPLAIMCLLMNPKTRRFYIPDDKPSNENNSEESNKGIVEKDINEMYDWIKKAVKEESFIEKLGEFAIKINKETGSRWDTITRDKCLVLKIRTSRYNNSCAICRYSDNQLDALEANQVNDKFLILDGIQYQSNNSSNELYYIKI